MNTPSILQMIRAERIRQDTKWGVQNHPPLGWIAILVEEVGEAAKGVLEGSSFKYRDEMIQVAAVAIAAIESLDRGNVGMDSIVKLQWELNCAKALLQKLKDNYPDLHESMKKEGRL